MTAADDQTFVRRAIRLAMNGRGRVEPNPMVGCVIVRDGRVIGQGYHQQFGGPHAEPNALANCTESPAGATAYVTLEPCCHTDKKTPPCAPRLIAAGVARVVVGCLDPNPKVNGDGVRALRESGIAVDGPVLEAECKQLIAPFLNRVGQGRPYVTLKWAESADGRVAGPAGVRRQISNTQSSHLVHQMRARSDLIMVGINTVLTDDPLLTARGVEIPKVRRFGESVPRRQTKIVLDARLRIPLTSRLVSSSLDEDVDVFCTHAAARRIVLDDAARLRDREIDVIPVPESSPGRLSLDRVLNEYRLPSDGTHLLVECGPTLAAGFFEAGLADRVWLIRSLDEVADSTAPSAAAVPDHYVATGTLDLDGDHLTEYLNTRGPAFFAPVPSADLVLAGSDLPGGGGFTYAHVAV